MVWGVFTISLVHDDWSTLTSGFNGIDVHVISSTPVPGRDRIIAMVRVSSSNAKSLKEFLNNVRLFHNIRNLEIIDSYSFKGRSIALVNLFTNFKGSITELVVLSDSYKYDERMYDGMEHWLILTSMRPSDLLDELKERADVKLFKWFNINDAASRVRKVALTSREVEVLEKAYELGYFNWPKDISLSELAKVLGVSKATLTQELRSIVRKLALREVTRIREHNALARLFE